MLFGSMLQKKEVMIFYFLIHSQRSMAVDPADTKYLHTSEKVLILLTERNIMTQETQCEA